MLGCLEAIHGSLGPGRVVDIVNRVHHVEQRVSETLALEFARLRARLHAIELSVGTGACLRSNQIRQLHLVLIDRGSS